MPAASFTAGMRYLIPILIVSGLLFALDYYVFRAWRRFARDRPLRWTIPVYRVLLGVMPLSLPLYFLQFSWWEVEPRFARALFFAFWSFYYVPKLPIVVVLLVKDLVRVVRPSKQPSESGITRGEFIRRIGWSAAAVPFAFTGYGVFRTLYDFAVHRVDIPIAGLPRALDGITIAQISDLHAGSLFSDRPMWDVVSIVNELKPDIVAVTGDFVNHDAAEMPRILPALRALEADLGIFGCLGNHEHYAQTDVVVGQIGTTSIDLLVNEHRTIRVDGAALHVIGTDNTGFNQNFADLPRAVSGIDPEGESARILLAHDPTFWDSHVRPDFENIDLMVCGHTHGGQFGMEIGPFRWSLAQMRYERWAGLYAEGRQFLYVNRGIGTVGPPLRLGIRPEITLLTLRRA